MRQQLVILLSLLFLSAKVGTARDLASEKAHATGLLTGVFTGEGHEAYYYDSFGREIQRFGTGFNVGRLSTRYRYDGQVASQAYDFSNAGMSCLSDFTVRHSYDSCGRPLAVTVEKSNARNVDLPPLLSKTVSGQPVTGEGLELLKKTTEAKVANVYDAIGRISSVGHGSNATTSYGYDVHGWLTSQSTAYAGGSTGYTLSYAPLWNGNVSKRSWDGQSYAFTYDAMNRLTAAAYTAPANSSADFSTSYSYDVRGNMLSLTRRGVTDRLNGAESFGLLDDLDMGYTGNRLTSLSASTEALPFEGVQGVAQNEDFTLTTIPRATSSRIRLEDLFPRRGTVKASRRSSSSTTDRVSAWSTTA